MIRLEALSEMPDGKSKLRHAAQALFDAAINDKNTAALAIIGDRLDGKPKVDQSDDGQVSLSFVVRLPAQADPTEWAKTINADAHWPAESETAQIEQIDGVPTHSEPILDASQPPPIEPPSPLVPGTPLDAVPTKP